MVDENNVYNFYKAEKQFILRGSIKMVAEKNNNSDVTDLKLDLDGDIFSSIITVSLLENS